MSIKIKYPLETIEEDLPYSELWVGELSAQRWGRRLNRLFGSQGIIKVEAEIGKPLKITRYKRVGED